MDESRYITKAQYRADKARLTRAQNSGDPEKVVDAVEKTLAGWEGKAWPDDWARWLRAIQDVLWMIRFEGGDGWAALWRRASDIERRMAW